MVKRLVEKVRFTLEWDTEEAIDGNSGDEV